MSQDVPVQVHLFTPEKETSALHNVFVVYNVEGLYSSMFGLWSEHPALATVLDLLGGKEGTHGGYKIYPKLSQEEFKGLVDMSKLKTQYWAFKQP